MGCARDVGIRGRTFGGHDAARGRHEVAERWRRAAGCWGCGSLRPSSSGLLVGCCRWLAQPSRLPVGRASTIGVERKDSAKLQYWHAMKLNTEDAWLARGAVFSADGPVNQVYVGWPNSDWRNCTVATNNWINAMQLYTELADDRTSRSLPRYGLIGKANVLANRARRIWPPRNWSKPSNMLANCRTNKSAACCSGSTRTSARRFCGIADGANAGHCPWIDG